MKLAIDIAAAEVGSIGALIAEAHGKPVPTTTADARRVIGEVLAEHLTRIVVGMRQAEADRVALDAAPEVPAPVVTVTA